MHDPRCSELSSHAQHRLLQFQVVQLWSFYKVLVNWWWLLSKFLISIAGGVSNQLSVDLRQGQSLADISL